MLVEVGIKGAKRQMKSMKRGEGGRSRVGPELDNRHKREGKQ